MTHVEWQDVAIAALTLLNTLVVAAFGALWGALSRTKQELLDLQRHIADTYARRDHLSEQIEQLMAAIQEVRAMVFDLLKRNQ